MFPREGYKIRYILGQIGWKFLNYVNRHSGEPSKIGHHFRKWSPKLTLLNEKRGKLNSFAF